MKIRKHSITMTRGDNEVLIVSLRDKKFTTGDVVELTVRQSAGYGPSLIHKTVTEFDRDGAEGKAVFEFEPKDTQMLNFDTYSYDVQATFQDIGVKTIVKPADFTVGRENTYV